MHSSDENLSVRESERRLLGLRKKSLWIDNANKFVLDIISVIANWANTSHLTAARQFFKCPLRQKLDAAKHSQVFSLNVKVVVTYLK